MKLQRAGLACRATKVQQARLHGCRASTEQR